MVDGAALMLTPFYAARASGFWGERGTNLLDTGAPFYEVYETADGKFVAVGAMEPKFYAELMSRLGLEADLDAQYDKTRWPDEKKKLAEVFRTKTRDEWCALLEGTDACFAPVLTPIEAPDHPHNRARDTFVELAGVPQPAPAPRFSRDRAADARAGDAPGRRHRRGARRLGLHRRRGGAVARHRRGALRNPVMPIPEQRDLDKARGVIRDWLAGKLPDARRPDDLARSSGPRSPASRTRRCSSTPRGTRAARPGRAGFVIRVKPTAHTIFLEADFESQYKVHQGARRSTPTCRCRRCTGSRTTSRSSARRSS